MCSKLVPLLVLLLAGCAAGGNNPNTRGDGSLVGRIQACRGGDTPVASASACLADDAACYQLANGSWCTGPRSDRCPAGSTELPAGSPCPPGARCFAHSESKSCAIRFN
ncbi:MAG: hypothetical protein KTR33_06020 [Gammaproteobacteria bacterium]|nr:hypothetical protein [Gammaproteobacteria bacterium]